jgi:hypothetical protein
VGNYTNQASVIFTDYIASIGIVIIALIALLVSVYDPQYLLIFSPVHWVGVLLRDQGSQLVRVSSLIRNSLDAFMTFRFANCSWIPALIAFLVAAGVGGKHFVNDQMEPASVVQIFNFAAVVAGFTLSWSMISSDYTAYFHPDVPRFVGFHGLPTSQSNDLDQQSAGEFLSTHFSASPSLL